MKKALIAMSGGVDSSVAAFFAKSNGCECHGITMRLYDESFINSESSCCTNDDIRDAEMVAEILGFEHRVCDFSEDFKEKVVDYFVSSYEKGITPNPCIQCNRYIKFDRLMQEMYNMGYDYVVTGHYADIVFENERYLLKKGKDKTKDQSYVLYSLTQDQLAHTVFPLGKYSKEEIRKIASENSFINHDKKDSQDICFIPDGDYAGFIERYKGSVYPEGDFVDKNGNVLGKHNGIIRYTIGQRKGLNIALGHPVYVVSKNVEKNTVVLGGNEDLFIDRLVADGFNWIIDKPRKKIRCYAKTRYNMKEVPCSAYCVEDRVVVEFDNPVRAITSGQAVVLYDGDYVLGGGVII